MEQRFWKGIFAGVAFLIIGLLVVSRWIFSGDEVPFHVNTEDPPNRIGATYMTMNNPFFSIINEELRSIVEGEGDILVTRDPCLDIQKQIEQVNDLIEMKVKVIIINPVNWVEIKPALEAAKKAGIPVIAVDTPVYDSDLVDCTIASENYQAGVQCGKHLLQNQEKANIIIMEHFGTKSAIDRIKGFKDTIASNPNYKVIARGNCDGQLETAMPVLEALLEEHPEVDVVMALNDPSALGSIAALKGKGYLHNVAVYGVDGSPEGKALVKEQMMTATAAQFPSEIGRIAGEKTYQILRGEAVEKQICVKVELITKDNVAEYGTDGWQ